MDNKLLPYKEPLFYRIKKFFMRIFNKDERDNKQVENITTSDISNSKKSDFIDDVKVNIDTKDTKTNIQNMDMNQFIDNLEKHPELMNNLSPDRLYKLSKYINKEIESYKAKIEKVKKTS